MKDSLMRARGQIRPIDSEQYNSRNSSAHVELLVDPGSTHSLIELSRLPLIVQKQIALFRENKSTPNNLNIRLHGETSITTLNKTETQECFSVMLMVQLGQWHGECEFIVLESMVNEKAILGADFMKRHQATLSFIENKQSITVARQSAAISFCRAAKSYTVPANSEIHI